MYDYHTEKPALFTEEGQRMFLRVRDAANKHCAEAGCVRIDALMRVAGSGSSGTQLACCDRLLELGEFREIPQNNCAGQHRIFVKR